MLDIRDSLASLKLPVLVVTVPKHSFNRPIIINLSPASDHIAFSRILGSKYISASETFQNLGDEELQKCYFPHDTHWNDRGALKFAEFITLQLKD